MTFDIPLAKHGSGDPESIAGERLGPGAIHLDRMRAARQRQAGGRARWNLPADVP